MPVCPIYIPHGLTRERNQASTATGRQLSASAMAKKKEREKSKYKAKRKNNVLSVSVYCVNKALAKDPYHVQRSYKMFRNLRIGPNNINLYYIQDSFRTVQKIPSVSRTNARQLLLYRKLNIVLTTT